MTTLAFAYFAVNTMLALGMHATTMRSTLERPRVLEFLAFFVFFLVAGLPLTLGAIVIGAISYKRAGRRPSMPSGIPQLRVVR